MAKALEDDELKALDEVEFMSKAEAKAERKRREAFSQIESIEDEDVATERQRLKAELEEPYKELEKEPERFKEKIGEATTKERLEQAASGLEESWRDYLKHGVKKDRRHKGFRFNPKASGFFTSKKIGLVRKSQKTHPGPLAYMKTTKSGKKYHPFGTKQMGFSSGFKRQGERKGLQLKRFGLSGAINTKRQKAGGGIHMKRFGLGGMMKAKKGKGFGNLGKTKRFGLKLGRRR